MRVTAAVRALALGACLATPAAAGGPFIPYPELKPGGEQGPAAPVCPGIDYRLLEARLDPGIRSWSVDGAALLAAFVALWSAAPRPPLRGVPDRVRVYAVPGHPLLVSYRRGDCVLAFLAVERRRLAQFLDREMGDRT